MGTIEDGVADVLVPDATLAAMVTELSNGLPAISGRLMPRGTKRPYVALRNLGSSNVEYNFGNVEDHTNEFLDIIVFSEDTESYSAQEVANNILARVKVLLHNQAIYIEGRGTLDVSYMKNNPPDWDVLSDEVAVYRASHLYSFTTSPA